MAVSGQVLFLNLKLRSVLRMVHGLSPDHRYNLKKHKIFPSVADLDNDIINISDYAFSETK